MSVIRSAFKLRWFFYTMKIFSRLAVISLAIVMSAMLAGCVHKTVTKTAPSQPMLPAAPMLPTTQ
jgi:hypothetical protein